MLLIATVTADSKPISSLGDKMSTEISTQVTPALHASNVKQIEGYDDESIAAVLAPTLNAFDTAYSGIRSVVEAREAAKRNPTWNEAQQILATADLSDKVFARVAKAMDSTRNNLVKGIAHLEQELSAPVESKAVASMANEIRSYVRGLKTEERQVFIQKAIADGDELSASAVLGAPPYLSGMTADMRNVLLRFWHTKQSPEKAARLKAMIAARDLIQERGTLVHSELARAVGMAPHQVKRLRDARTASEQAFVLKDVA